MAQTDGAFEVRSYPQLAVVRTSSESDDGSFMRLFRYIGGANATQEKISMTTPVFMEKGTMNFVLPDDKKAHPPKPTQDNVQLTTLPARRVATYRFSGFTSRKSEATALARLKTWLLSQKISFRDEPTYAYYNSPFTLPHLRRNEVHLPLEP